jgi:PAS domain S-box-containing protein
MREIVSVKLENEMDLILAHKRAMKLCELTGFSLISQTSIATAVSEISRCAIDAGKNAVLTLGIDIMGGKKYLKAVVSDTADFTKRAAEASSYAKRLVNNVEVIRNARDVKIVLTQSLNFPGTLTESRISSFVDYFKTEPPLSPYDELRRKNLLLQDLADKIKESENEYRVLTDSIPLMIFSVNNRGVITYTNKWLQQFLGTTPKEFNATAWQPYIHPSEFSAFSKELNSAMQRQQPLNIQYRVRERATGQYLWHIISAIPLKNEKDIISQWIGFLADIDAHKLVEQTLKDNRSLKQTQEQLFQNQEDLQRKVLELNRSNYELEQFAHLASHDLQEPLRKLFFYSDMLKRKYKDRLDDAGINMINNMVHATGRMKELINDLLTYSQIHKQKVSFEVVDLNQVIRDILKDLDMVIKEKKAVFEVQKLPAVPGNVIRLRQLFTNLISNALKYSRIDVTPHVKITASASDENVSISIRDNGIGFEEQYKEKIFGLFERLHTRDKYPGTGIGLSICKRIAELHNGTISAVSRPNEYSVFHVTLPLEQEPTVYAE